jgi:type II secretory pathway component PulF
MGATHPVALSQLGTLGNGATEGLRGHFAREVARGTSLRDAAASAPSGALDRFEGALVTLGEETGTLERSLRLLADWHAAQHRLLLKLWSRSTYPLFLWLAAAVLLPLPLVFQGRTVAYFATAGAGVALWFLLGGTIVESVARTRAGHARWVRARLARALATALEASAPLDRAIDLAVQATGDREIEAHVKRVPLVQRRAQPVSETFRDCPLVPEELLAAMRVAETTGDWRTTVGRMGELYEDGF